MIMEVAAGASLAYQRGGLGWAGDANDQGAPLECPMAARSLLWGISYSPSHCGSRTGLDLPYRGWRRPRRARRYHHVRGRLWWAGKRRPQEGGAVEPMALARGRRRRRPVSAFGTLCTWQDTDTIRGDRPDRSVHPLGWGACEDGPKRQQALGRARSLSRRARTHPLSIGSSLTHYHPGRFQPGHSPHARAAGGPRPAAE